MAITGVLHEGGENVEQEVMTVLASADRTKGDIVYLTLGEDGPVDVTVADNAAVHLIGVWTQDCSSGDRGLVAIKGPVQATVASGTYTAGNGIKVHDGATADTGSSFAGCVGDASTDFAVALESGTTVTSLYICLAGGPFTSTT